MENEMDLTLRLGLPNPTVDTQLTLYTPPSDQEINVNGGYGDNTNGGENTSLRHLLYDEPFDDDEGARNNVNVNVRVYNHIFQHFAGVGETLNFAPYPMPPAPAPAPASNYVLIDVPARRAHRNNQALAIPNALDANVNAILRRSCCCGMIEDRKRCTNLNCNAVNTPMWRRGPLGPKSLCNACGIKFRKEEERKSKRETK